MVMMPDDDDYDEVKGTYLLSVSAQSQVEHILCMIRKDDNYHDNTVFVGCLPMQTSPIGVMFIRKQHSNLGYFS